MRARSRSLSEDDLFAIGAEWDDDDARGGGGRRPVAGALSGALTAALFVGLLALYASPPEPAGPQGIADLLARPEPTLTAPPPVWRDLATPRITLGLDAAGFAGLPSRHTARAHGAGAVEDTLVFGAFAEEGTHLRLTLHRAGAEGPQPPARSFFVETALAAAEAGLAVARSGQAQALATKFGPIEVATLTLENGPVRACLAFRGRGDPRLSGWLCADEATPAHLACLVDGLVLLDDGGDARLSAAFDAAAAARAPSGCAPRAEPDQVAAIAPPATAQVAAQVVMAPTPPARPGTR
ncbi:hypothetical protein [Salinarimonas sp.]|uniref:hypothetical protein n=1 Tax=Salinarimonas sp. TaxID=2766526 RepID=UPI0032D95907